MAAPRKYPPEIRDDAHHFVNVEGLSVPRAAQALEDKHGQPFTIDLVRRLAREERFARTPSLAQEPKDKQLHQLLTGLVDATNREIARLQNERGAIDADQLLKLANTVKTLEPLLKAPTNKNGAGQTNGFLARIEGDDTHEDERTSQDEDAGRSSSV